MDDSGIKSSVVNSTFSNIHEICGAVVEFKWVVLYPIQLQFSVWLLRRWLMPVTRLVLVSLLNRITFFQIKCHIRSDVCEATPLKLQVSAYFDENWYWDQFCIAQFGFVRVFYPNVAARHFLISEEVFSGTLPKSRPNECTLEIRTHSLLCCSVCAVILISSLSCRCFSKEDYFLAPLVQKKHSFVGDLSFHAHHVTIWQFLVDCRSCRCLGLDFVALLWFFYRDGLPVYLNICNVLARTRELWCWKVEKNDAVFFSQLSMNFDALLKRVFKHFKLPRFAVRNCIIVAVQFRPVDVIRQSLKGKHELSCCDCRRGIFIFFILFSWWNFWGAVRNSLLK